ncbi:MAG: rhodanese-like domain-containing protein [Alphaproteobacteria bacterium]|nr:MAG: rhodanese-like domain-containing protein [Alphaproteobacteria bacterium]
MAPSTVGEVDPVEAWEILKNSPDAILVDVRSMAEWSFVGIPNLDPIGKQVILEEWRRFPGMELNEGFVDRLLAQFDSPPSTMLFLCRSGVRSMEAAQAVAERLRDVDGMVHCLNVAEGFEGKLDEESHRGRVNGWKVRGLSWKQS